MAEFVVSDNGYMYDGAYRYEIIGENKLEMVQFLRETCASEIKE